MNIFEFMGQHPFLTAFIVWAVLQTLFVIINCLFRTITMFKNGYPPAHCDADGDFKIKDLH